LALPNARLVIAGPDEGARDLITRYVDERSLIGFLGETERLAALDAADLFALPAVGEGLSMALLEALAAGLPALITPGCNMPEVVEYGAGLEVPRTVDALEDALYTLLTDAALRETMSHNARRLVRERFTWDVAATKLEAVYASAAGSRAQP
jgi:poly(glycerol-phosphate) alpha-glucosyltransferase